MTPDWYHAQGDPPGTQRYWDGAQWIGEPVYEPAAAPVPGPLMSPPPPQYSPHPAYAAPLAYPAQAPSPFPGSLKAVAIIVSVLKAIPLVLGIVLVIAVASWVDDFDNDGFFFEGDELGGLVNAAVVILLIFALVGAVLIGFQFIGAIKERPLMVAIPAIIMSVLDSLVTLGTWTSYTDSTSSPGGAFMMTAITAAQIFVAVQALKANKS